MLRGVVRKGIAHFCVAFSYGSASSRHASKCFIQKVLSHFILLYFACCWDFSGTSVHTWSESHNFSICVHGSCNILSNQLTVAYCHALHFYLFGLVVGYVFGSVPSSPLSGNCLTHTETLSSLYLPYQFAVTLCKCLCDFAVISLYFLLFSANNYNSRQT